MRGSRPRGAQKISLNVAGGGKSTSVTQSVLLRCGDGTTFPVTIEGLTLTGNRGFKTSAEDPAGAAAIQGRFLTAKLQRKRRSVAVGALYVSVGVKPHGQCASFVAFAARGPRVG